MFDLIFKYYLIEKSLSVLFNALNTNIGQQSTVRVGDIVKVTFKDCDGTEATFHKCRIMEMSSYHMMLDTPTTEWKLNLLESEQREMSLMWKTMQTRSCELLYSEDEYEIWKLTHTSPWFIDYKSISNLVVEKI